MPQSAQSVLVLDANTRAALAVVRSLGKAGYQVTVAGETTGALAARSRYCSDHLRTPSVLREPKNFANWLISTLQHRAFTWLLPVSDASLQVCLKHEAEIRKLTSLPTPDLQTCAQVVNKQQLLAHAATLGVGVPTTLLIPATAERGREDIDAIRRFPFPAVLKPVSSISIVNSRFLQGRICYPQSAEEVLRFISGIEQAGDESVPYLLQEYISGKGIGVFAICQNGEPLTTFCHRRILEKPPSGGRSVLSESISPSEAPVEEAVRLLRSYHWNGVAMVEFKEDSLGKARLMEINPRFWGSLQLAIDAGRDFPKLLLDAFSTPVDEARQRCGELPAYHIGVRLRWELGSLDHLLIRAKQNLPSTLSDLVLRNSLQIFRRPRLTSWEVFRWDDPLPFFAELRQYVADLLVGTRRSNTPPQDETPGW